MLSQDECNARDDTGDPIQELSRFFAEVSKAEANATPDPELDEFEAELAAIAAGDVEPGQATAVEPEPVAEVADEIDLDEIDASVSDETPLASPTPERRSALDLFKVIDDDAPTPAPLDDASAEMLDEIEKAIAEDEAEAAAKAAEKRSKVRPARLDATTGKRFGARRAAARAAVEPILAKSRELTLNDIRRHLPRLDKEMDRRINALRNAGKTINNAMLRQLCRTELQIEDAGHWWQAIAVAHLLHGVDATLHQIAGARRTMDRRARRACAVSEDRAKARQQARHAYERTMKLECPGMPWRRYQPQ